MEIHRHRRWHFLLLITISSAISLIGVSSETEVGGFDYGEALSKSLLYFEAQRSGRLPYNQRVTWRDHSGLTDGLEQGVDLVGGYHDAGDHVKFGLPMAFTVTMLSWSVIEYGDSLASTGELSHALEAIKWGTDYFIKAHTSPNVLWAEVGDGDTDHYCWQRPEDMTTSRRAFKIDENNPGSDLAGETAAAMAAASIVFRTTNPHYSHLLLHHAQQLFEFGDKYRGKYDESLRVVKSYYASVSGYMDELLWGATWLYRATDNDHYMSYVVDMAPKTSNVIFWDHQSFFITMDPYKYRPSSAYNAPFYTTNGGAPVSNNISSLTIGERGPVLLEDYHLIEKVANFTRERIPERVVHARGISAKGFFEVTHDISNLTCADFLRAPGVQTPVIVRFSTVVHERASPETMRDIRGFAVKFYTREGNFDLVGNNTPVFFIRDGIQFPDVVHALKPNPKTNIQEYWRILDYMSHLPESLLTWCWMFDDVGIPQDYRHMEGFGVHTYTLVSKSGKVLFVKFHWKPTCGIKNLTDEEAKVVGGANHSHATKDLHDAIASGNYPEWKLFIQTMDPADEDKFDFDPLDVTKIWPEDILPLQPVGRLVLNRTIDNFFNETEQLAFNPGLVVPGIYYSDDKLLQCRIFAYGDTQRHRLGPNYLQLPVNAPKCAHHNNHHEGFMNFMHRDEEINYYPSKFDPVRCAEKAPIPNKSYTGIRTKCIIKKENNFKQPGDRYRSWAPDRQDRFVKRWVEILSEPRLTHEIRGIWISYWSQADRSLGQKLASRLNVRPSI